jgi:hypothetical protein
MDMSEQPATPVPQDLPKLLAELIGRLSALEQEVAVLRGGRTTLGSVVPYTRPTDEEVYDMMHGPRGQPILEIIEEYEKKLTGE